MNTFIQIRQLNVTESPKIRQASFIQASFIPDHYIHTM